MEVTVIPFDRTEIVNKIYTACRTCYMAGTPQEQYKKTQEESTGEEGWEKKWKLINHVISSGHHCYDAETEVLTDKGFKYWKDVNEDDKLGVFDPLTCKLVGFEVPEELIVEDYTGKMFLYDSPKCNLMITPHHRLFCSLSNSTENRIVSKFAFYHADDVIRDKSGVNEVAKKPLRFTSSLGTIMGGTYNPLNLPPHKIIPFIQLIGFFIGDGFADGGNRLEFHIKKQRKIGYLRKLVSKLDFEFKELSNNKYKVFYKGLGNWALDNLYENKVKVIPKEFFYCSKDEIEALIDGLLNSDGSFQKGVMRYHGTSYNVVSSMHALLCLLGKRYSFKECKKQKKEWNSVYTVTSMCRSMHPHLNDSRSRATLVKEVYYSGKVYCARVSTGLLLVRRGESIKYPILSGNSTLEHVSFTFLISGVSRALSHQLARHRIGISLSQQSQRYCEFKDGNFNFVYPPTVLKSIEATKVFDECIEKISQTYSDLINLGIPAEDARMVLPNACCTNLTVTMNLRELIHFTDERCCTCAQWEIRDMANRMAKLIYEEIPELRAYLGPKCASLGYCNESAQRSCGRKPTLTQMMKDLKELARAELYRIDAELIQGDIENGK